MRKRVVLTVLVAVLMAVPGGAMTPEQQRQYLDKLRQILPDVPVSMLGCRRAESCHRILMPSLGSMASRTR